MTIPQTLQKPLTIAALICGIIAGVAALVAAIVLKQVAYGAWGVAFVAGSIIAFVSGAKGRPDGAISPPTIGAKFENIPMWAWLIIAGLCVAATVLTFVFPPWR
jgi:hypothetical protein